jgi:AsmA protein
VTVFGSLVLVGGVALALVLASIDQRALTERVASRVLAASSETLGRELSIEGARGRLLPSPRVTLEQVTLAGREGEPPIVAAHAVEVRLRLWPLVRSLGREVRIDDVVVHRPAVHVERAEDGTLNVDGLLRRGRSDVVLTVARVAVHDGTLRFVEEGRTRMARGIDLTIDMDEAGAAAVRGQAAVASEQPNVTFDVRTAPREASWPTIDGTVSARDVELAELVDGVRSGRGTIEAQLVTRAEVLEATGTARLVDVRTERHAPIGASSELTARIEPARPEHYRVELRGLSLRGPGVAARGRAELAPGTVRFALAGPELDLDRLEAAMSRGRGGSRAPVEQLAASGTLRFDRVVRGRVELRDVATHVQLRNGTVQLRDAHARWQGARVDPSGSVIDLRGAVPSWRLRTRVEGLEVARALAALGRDVPLAGTLDATIDLAGRGAEWTVVRRSLEGAGSLSVTDAAWTELDLGAEVASRLAEGLRQLGQRPAEVGEALARGRTTLRVLGAEVAIGDEAVTLRDPIVLETELASARVEGRIGLDRSLALTGTLIVPPALIERVAGVRPSEPIELPVRIGGTLGEPRVALPPPRELARRLVEPAARAGVARVQREVEDRIEREVEGLGGEVEARLGDELGRRARRELEDRLARELGLP